jgi:hypothetical protein
MTSAPQTPKEISWVIADREALRVVRWRRWVKRDCHILGGVGLCLDGAVKNNLKVLKNKSDQRQQYNTTHFISVYDGGAETTIESVAAVLRGPGVEYCSFQTNREPTRWGQPGSRSWYR